MASTDGRWLRPPSCPDAPHTLAPDGLIGINSNVYDVVPNAWQTLGNLNTYYPAGPQADTTDILGIVNAFLNGIAGLPYGQPTPNPYPINIAVDGYYLMDGCHLGGHTNIITQVADLKNTED